VHEDAASTSASSPRLTACHVSPCRHSCYEATGSTEDLEHFTTNKSDTGTRPCQSSARHEQNTHTPCWLHILRQLTPTCSPLHGNEARLLWSSGRDLRWLPSHVLTGGQRSWRPDRPETSDHGRACTQVEPVGRFIFVGVQFAAHRCNMSGSQIFLRLKKHSQAIRRVHGPCPGSLEAHTMRVETGIEHCHQAESL
jgi:hypothetical protein